MNKKNFDRMLFIMALVVLALGIAIRIGIRAGETTVVFSQWWKDEMERDTLESLAREFERLNRGIHIRLDTRPYRELRNSLTLSGGEEKRRPCDVLALEQGWLPELKRRNILEPLEGYLAAPDSAVIAPHDETAALPLVSFTTLLFYNTDILSGRGFNHPPKTWEEVRNYAQGLAVSPREAALVLALDNGQDILSWFWASGETLYREGAIAFNTPGFIAVLDFFQSLQLRGSLAPLRESRQDKLKDFAASRAAMMTGSVRDLVPLTQRLGDNLGVSTIPVPGNHLGRPLFAAGDWYAGIARWSRHKEAAWKWLAFLAGKSAVLAKGSGGIPRQGDSVVEADADIYYSKAADIYEAGRGVQDLPELAKLDYFEKLLEEGIGSMLSHNLGPKETAALLQQRWDDL